MSLIGKYLGKNNNMHYFKSMQEFKGRILHVVVNPYLSPQKVITVYFDRKATKEKMHETEDR